MSEIREKARSFLNHGAEINRHKLIHDLLAELERVESERDRLANDALTALAGVVCTPVEGFVKVPYELKTGILELRKLKEAAEQRVAEFEAEIKAKDAQFRLCAAHGGNAADPAPKYCPKCLESQVAELEASLKKVQNIAMGAMDKLTARWNMGFQAGLKQAIPHEKALTDALTAERQWRKDDNAALTEDILRLEAENARLKALEDKMGSGWALVEYENARQQAAMECVEIIIKETKPHPLFQGSFCNLVISAIKAHFAIKGE